MRKREFTEFGKEVKLELILQNQTQEWLIKRVRERSGMYVDSSIVYKILTGQVSSSALESHIREILHLAQR